MNTSLTRVVQMVVAPVILGLGVTACTQGASPPPPTQGFTTGTPTRESAPPSSAPMGSPARTPTRESAPPSSAPLNSPTAATSGEQSTESSRTACTSRMLQELQKKFEGRSPRMGVPDVRIERCANGYAHAFSPATGGDQYFLQYLNGSWQVEVEGTGVACSDPEAGAALLRACTALEYRTTAVLQRISDPQVVADHLVCAWMPHDTLAATKLSRDGAPIEVLFSHQAPSTTPTSTPCRLVRPGQFACSYTIAPHTELTLIVAGGASAGYEVTGAEFGD